MSSSERDGGETARKGSKDPLMGITLEKILTVLELAYGWEGLGARIPVNCFLKDPSLKSSLTFLRKTPWARTKVENLYREHIKASPK